MQPTDKPLIPVDTSAPDNTSTQRGRPLAVYKFCHARTSSLFAYHVAASSICTRHVRITTLEAQRPILRTPHQSRLVHRACRRFPRRVTLRICYTSPFRPRSANLTAFLNRTVDTELLGLTKSRFPPYRYCVTAYYLFQ